MEAASTRVKTSAPGIVAVPNDKAEAEGVTEGTGDAEGVAPRFRLAVGVGDDEAVGVGDCVTLRRSGCADVDGRDVSEMVGVAVVVEVAEDVGVAVGVEELDADEPLDLRAVGVTEGVGVTDEPVEGVGVGVGGVRNMLNGLL